MSTTRFHSAGSVCHTVAFAPAIPALFTRISIFPISATVASTARLTDPNSVTSTSTAITRPNPANSTRACSATTLSKSQIATLAPDSSNRSTIARPIPLAPPVTTAVLFCRLI